MRENIGLYCGKPKTSEDYFFFSQNWKDNCEKGFVYGNLIVSKGKYYICVSAMGKINCCINNGTVSMIEVIPETVGQYTGLTDKNGKKIFEGDILQFGERKMSVFWNGETLSWEMKDVGTFDSAVNHLINTLPLGEVQVEWCYGEMSTFIIGSIYDNSELLK